MRLTPFRRLMNALAGLLLVTLTACQTSPPQEATTEADGFRPLFNGRDLTGWVNVNCAPETWRATNGVIYCTGKPIGALRTERQYENFIFEVEWRHLKSAGNAGIFVWASPISWPGVPFLRAIEVQVLDHGYGQSPRHTTHGDVFPIHGSRMEPFGRHNGMRSFPSEERSRPSPEWNHYRIVATNGVLRLSVNGKEVSGGTNCVWRKGYLALESEGSPVEFRHLRLKELPGGPATPEQTAPAETDWESLYNGVDLRGWQPGTGNGWQPSDWRLLARPGAQTTPLRSARSFGSFELLVDCRTPETFPVQGDLGQVLVGDHVIPLGGAAPGGIDRAKLKPRSWHRIKVRRERGQLSLWLDGQPVGEPRPWTGAAAPVTIGLGAGSLGAEFANLYVRELR